MKAKTESPIHIGAILKQYIDGGKIYKAALAKTLGVNDSVVLAYQKRANLNTMTLMGLCDALKHNFFADIAAQLPQSFTTTVAQDLSHSIKIAQLEQEITILKAEKAILLEAFKNR